ncbi:T9SS sorting signal type C domain-containing protein [Flavobacterium ustbae]|uniref:T9SS sorting signal type C domain-containing protein n=1 Tax=Flavobacterium ustbae TaxID=2488790 RepID=UPI000F7B550C|nr:T9SS sorting signal type C domain-containing protein [Flavobacterium ustbae]
MKKDLLITLNFFSFFSLVTYIGKQLKFGWSFKILLILILSFFHTTSKAQIITHPVATSNPSFPLPAGITEITVEAWGGGGGGGAALGGNGWGRGGAGGAGGAYALGKITGITTSTLNVVVAKATAASTGNGANGEPSYIANFTGTFYAQGGQGGAANLPATGNTPPAATPASTGSIGSMTTINGAASGPGYNSLLNVALSSGNGGNAGNFGQDKGGAGGLGYASLLGANGAGRSGLEYGGGGSGAASSLILLSPSTLYNGGSGARGHVNITYTCKPYSLTGISAANVCTAVGTTSQVQLTGTSTSLPAGTYTVTYNTSIPLATGLTETMTVAGGIGSFTARGLNTPGTSRITVTSLKSLDCPSTISSNNVVDITVSGQPTITLGATTAVCTSSNVQSVTMPYSGITNFPTTYSIIWNASPSNTFAAVTNATLQGGSISIPVPGGTAAGTYTGTLTVRNAIGCVSANNSFTVTVNPLPAITLGTATTVCTSASVQSVTLPYSGAVNSPTTYSITWNASPSNTFAAVTNAALQGGSISIPVPGGTAAGTYTGTLTVRNGNSCVSANNNFTVTVNPLPSITLGAATAVCTSTNVQSVTLPYSGATNSPTTYSITWNASPSNSFAAVTDASLPAGSISIPVPGGTAAGTYTGSLTVKNANGCASASNTFNITVNSVSVPVASVTQQPTCINNTGVITVTSPAAGTGYTYSIDGVDFSNTTGIFSGLSSGSYDVQARNTATGCESVATQITINAFVTKVWNGNADANWGNPANWTPTGVPIASDCIDIPDVGVDPVISGTNASFFASRLTIQNNGSLIVNGTNTITVTNEVNVLGNGVLTFENNSSLVQVEDVANTGNIIYKRNTTPVRRYDVTYWSSPVTRDPMFTLHDLSPNTLWDKFHKFDSASSQWIVISDGAEEMIKGNGYSIRAPQFYDLNSTQIYGGEFKGVPNNGTILGPVGVTGKLSSLGNPYPSAIYADQFISDNSSRIYGTLYFWTHNSLPTQIPGTTIYSYSSNDFAYYNLSGETEVGGMEGTPAPTPGNQSTPAGFIAAGQGFLARSLTGEPVVFTNSMRVPNLNSQFYRSSAAAAIERHRVWLNFTNELGAFKQLLIGYVTGATNSWDNSYDATTMNANPHVDFYSVNDGKKLVIQGRAVPFVVTDTIQLGYKSTIEEGEFTIAIDRTDGDLSNQDIYLQDNLTNTIHNLKTGGYTFTSAPGTFLKRFVLRYTNSNDTTLGNEDFENQDQKILVSVRDKNIRLQSVSEQENLQEVAIYDTGGKLLYVKKQLQNKEWVVTNFQSGPQVLLVKITLDNGKTITRKIVFQ